MPPTDPRTLSQGNSLNSAQLTKLQQHYESQVKEIVASLNLRKWIVEQLLTHAPNIYANADDFVSQADKIHAFITAPTLKPFQPPEDEAK